VTAANPTLAQLQHRYRRLASELTRIGFTLKGSLVERYMTCGTPSCRCHTDPTQRHGPYWQWSTAVAGKTVSRRLSPEQASCYKELIDNRKRLEATLAEMADLSHQAAELLCRPADR
jgi:Family of unknown function (DUF6788)